MMVILLEWIYLLYLSLRMLKIVLLPKRKELLQLLLLAHQCQEAGREGATQDAQARSATDVAGMASGSPDSHGARWLWSLLQKRNSEWLQTFGVRGVFAPSGGASLATAGLFTWMVAGLDDQSA